jgi:hypothetical protein
MKKSTKDFLINLEKNASIIVDWSNLQPTEKYLQSNNQPVEIDTINVNRGNFIFMVYSCDCKTCKEVIAVQIFYGLGDSKLTDAETLKNLMHKVAPKTKVEIYNMLDLTSIG